MASDPSIQSFFQKETSSASPHATAKFEAQSAPEDETNAPPSTVEWSPSQEYRDTQICHLMGGPGAVKIRGRIVNYFTAREIATRRSFLPRGNHFLVINDGTGVIAVKLLALAPDEPRIRLGTLVTVWTTFVADFGTSLSIHIPFISHVTSVQLAEHSGSCLKFHDEVLDPNESSLCRTPLYYNPSSKDDVSLPDLINLKAYLLSGNNGMTSPKILVCVRSVGPRKIVQPGKHEAPSHVVDVSIFDETDSCVLKVWGEKGESVKEWKPNETILLLTNPTYWSSSMRGSKGDVLLGFTTMIDVDPVFPDAQWLRQFAFNSTKKESICMQFPYEHWDVAKAVKSTQAALFTIAEIDDFARDGPTTDFTGKLSVIILGMNMSENVRMGKLCCAECCGIPIFSNEATATCKNCSCSTPLLLNPCTVGLLADETGCIAAGKIVWSDEALAQLFFGNFKDSEVGALVTKIKCLREDTRETSDGNLPWWQNITWLSKDDFRSIEERLIHARLTLTFGWSCQIGRLCVLWAEW